MTATGRRSAPHRGAIRVPDSTMDAPHESPRRVRALINPASGQDEAILAILHRTCAEAGIEWRCEVSRGQEHLGELLRAARGAGPEELVLVSGGDGTVAAAAEVFAGGEVPFGILPGGTGNVVAQEVGLPRGYEDAARALILGPVEAARIDRIRAGEDASLLRAGFGGDARLMERADRAAKDRLGWGAYLLAAVEQVATGDTATYRIEADGVDLECEALTVLVLNIGRLGRGGFVLSNGIAADDGMLDVVVVRSGSLGAVAEVVRSMSAREGTLPSLTEIEARGERPVEHLRARELTVTPQGAVEFQVDGETRGTVEGPLSFRVEARSVPLWVPRPRDLEDRAGISDSAARALR